jgi:hypothetical protein
MVKKIEGCAHLIIKEGKVISVHTHLNKYQKEGQIKNGVIHLKGDKIYSIEEFKKSHPRDHHELKKTRKRINLGKF